MPRSSSPGCPKPVREPSASDIALAEAGDKAAYFRVANRRSRIRKREREIDQWHLENPSDVGMSYHDDALSCDGGVGDLDIEDTR